jgi:hypothetical protein
MDSPELRSAIARAVGRCGEAIDRVPSGPHREAWARMYGRPAMEALHALCELLEQIATPRRAPTVILAGPGHPTALTPTSVIELRCPHRGRCVGTPMWNPFGGHHGRYEPRRPSVPVVRQVATALVEALGRALNPTELAIGLRAASTCSLATARRALRAAVLEGALRADAWNRITVPPWSPPAESAPPGPMSP